MRAVHVLLVATVLLAAIPVAPAETTVDALRKAEQQCDRGARFLMLGNYRRAERWFARAVGTIEGYPEAHVGLGHIAMAERRFEDALAAYAAAVKGYEDLGDLLIERQATAYRDARLEIARIHRAIADVERLGSQFRFTPAQMQARIREYRHAIEMLETIEPPDPDAAGEAPGAARFFLGNALFRVGRTEEAVQEWDACLERSPKFPYAFNNLAVAHWKLGRIEEALRCLDRAESLGMAVNPDLRSDLERASRSMGRIVL